MTPSAVGRAARRLGAVGIPGDLGFLLAQELTKGRDGQHPIQKAVRPGRMLEVPPEPLADGASPELTSETRRSSAFAYEPPEKLAAVADQISHEDEIPAAKPLYPAR